MPPSQSGLLELRQREAFNDVVNALERPDLEALCGRLKIDPGVHPSMSHMRMLLYEVRTASLRTFDLRKFQDKVEEWKEERKQKAAADAEERRQLDKLTAGRVARRDAVTRDLNRIRYEYFEEHKAYMTKAEALEMLRTPEGGGCLITR